MRKVALTLDSGHGLMGAVAVGLADAGFDLVLHVRPDGPDPDGTLRRVRALGRRATVVSPGQPARVGASPDRAGMGPVLDAVRREHGRLDVLVTRGGGEESVEEAAGAGSGGTVLRHAVETALRAPFHAIQGALPLLARHAGAVVNVVDAEGGAASGEGLVYLTQLLARELRPRVRVNAVTVGARGPRGRPGSGTEGMNPGVGMKTLGTRAADPEELRELTRVVLFLLGSPWINGEVMRIGEGRS